MSAGAFTEPTAVAVPAPGSATAAPLAGAVVVANTGAAVGDDSYVLNAASVTDDMLTISVSYGGGCRTHALTLVISESFIETSPVQLSSVLAHYANNDPCEAFLTHSYTFDLSVVRTRYREAYGPGPGRVVLQLDSIPDGRLVYDFTV